MAGSVHQGRAHRVQRTQPQQQALQPGDHSLRVHQRWRDFVEGQRRGGSVVSIRRISRGGCFTVRNPLRHLCSGHHRLGNHQSVSNASQRFFPGSSGEKQPRRRLNHVVVVVVVVSNASQVLHRCLEHAPVLGSRSLLHRRRRVHDALHVDSLDRGRPYEQSR